MKNLLLIFILTLSLSTYAQAPFEGKITYSLDVRGERAQQEKQDLPKEVVAIFKDGKMRFDVITPKLNFHIITIESSHDATFMIELKDEITLKMALKTSTNELKKEFDIDETPKTHFTRERKTIAGYKCKKVVIDSEDGEIYAYVSEDLNAQNLNWLLDENITGTMLEFILVNKERSEGIILQAREVRKMNISDNEFNVPSDYMVISTDGLKNMFGEDGIF